MTTGVEFEEDKFNYGTPRSARQSGAGPPRFSGYNKPVFAAKEPKMVQWLMDHGIAGSPVAAQAVLIVVIVINIVITYIVLKYLV